MKNFIKNWLFSSIFVTLIISLPTSLYGIIMGEFSSVSEFFLFFFKSSLYVGKFALVCFFIGSFLLPKKWRNETKTNVKAFGYKWVLLEEIKKIEHLAKKEEKDAVMFQTLLLCQKVYQTIPRLNLLFNTKRKEHLSSIFQKDFPHLIKYYASLSQKEKEENKESVLETLHAIDVNLTNIKKGEF